MEGAFNCEGDQFTLERQYVILTYYHQALSDSVSWNAQTYTLYSSVRPFGVSTIFGGVDKSGPSLYIVEPSGVCLVSALEAKSSRY